VYDLQKDEIRVGIDRYELFHQPDVALRYSIRARWIPAYRRRPPEVTTGRHEPWCLVDSGKPPLEAARQAFHARVTPSTLVAEDLIQQLRCHCGDGHPLAVDGVEGTDRIAQNDEAFW
jgi:hypothetical protein